MAANSKAATIEIPEDEEEDVEFLSQLEAAEAQALSFSATKRRRVSVESHVKLEDERQNQSFVEEIEEGAYTAALKGSKSRTWQKQLQQQQQQQQKQQSNFATVGGGGGGTACFRCGNEGHWARECPKLPTSAVAGNVGNVAPPSMVAGVEKVCPCGMGNCLVLTANTERNRGRKFFRCPARQENGGCGFFEWCDESSEKIASSGEAAWKNGGQQQSYQRPTSQAASGYTKSWNDFDRGISAPNSSYGQKFETTDNKANSIMSGSSACFKCGQQGHWARDCLSTSSNVSAGARENPSSGACYKCGQSGHWARDCTQGQSTTKFRTW